MASKICCICENLIQEGERVELVVRSTYHALKSKAIYALDQSDMEAVEDTLCHTSCADECKEMDDEDDKFFEES